MWKRVLDIFGALVGMILLLPIFLLIILVIKIVSPGPVFFKQVRLGYSGKPFLIYKFRTMHVNADTAVHKRRLSDLITREQPMTKLDLADDPRIIPFGKHIRSMGIDELPQLINVLQGDMSLVGPRPCLPYEAEQYLLWQTGRFDAVPGITGLWQVSGKNRVTFKDMIRMDIMYARKRTFWLDIKIIVKTFPAVYNQINESFNSKDKYDRRSQWKRS
jgi:lipopolysaccharide/colanic/teichoic acid biosynthesis glycosyltransferase